MFRTSRPYPGPLQKNGPGLEALGPQPQNHVLCPVVHVELQEPGVVHLRREERGPILELGFQHLLEHLMLASGARVGGLGMWVCALCA